MKLDINQRRTGVFAPVFALRTASDMGIGDTGSVRQMIAWCRKQGFSVLQILPINETGDDHSPYNAVSAFALEPTTLEITPKLIPCLTAADIKKMASAPLLKTLRAGSVQYKQVKKLKRDLLDYAFKKFVAPKAKTAASDKKAFASFLKEEKNWLEDYTLFRALMKKHGHPDWERWPKEHQTPAAARKWLAALPAEEKKAFLAQREFFSFVQWLLHRQWSEVRAEAESQGVYLMGDAPFGISRCSADVWAHPQWFDLKWSGGAPPESWFKGDFFTEKWGQNWGVPVYNWATMKADDYSWWRQRIRQTVRYFHLFRIDHVLGLYRIYAFPWQPKDNGLYVNLTPEKAKAKAGDLPRFLPRSDEKTEDTKLNRQEGEERLRMILEAAGDATVIAEDLGLVPDYVRPSLTDLGVSGFKIPIFEREQQSQEYKKPEDYPVLSVATLSTHDHETMLGFWENWWTEFKEMERRRAAGKLEKNFEEHATRTSWEIYRTQRFARLDDRAMIRDYEPQVREGACRRLLHSRSWLAILMITDALGLKLRFNVPGPVADSNWSSRLPFTVKEMAESPAWEHIRSFLRQSTREAERLHS
ncbi:MAG: 4-alpha-glucanotransferase [bacterium]